MPKKRVGIPENSKIKEGTEGKYKKYCPRCKKIYFTDVRHQKFCSKECQKAAALRQKEQKKYYNEAAPALRLSARAHALAVSTYDLLVSMGIRRWECKICGENNMELLEIHHFDINPLNNTPSNLECLCHKCHSKRHSDIQKDLDDKGILVEEHIDKSFLPIYKILTKDKE